LFVGLDLQQHDFFRRMSVQNRALQQFDVAALIQAVEKWRQMGVEQFIQAVSLRVCLSEGNLKAVDRGEALNFNQLRLQTSAGIANEAEIGLHEERMRGFVRYIELRRNGRV